MDWSASGYLGGRGSSAVSRSTDRYEVGDIGHPEKTFGIDYFRQPFRHIHMRGKGISILNATVTKLR